MQVVLVMFRSDGERKGFSLARDVTIIGRREDCDLRIPLGEVSRKHCRVIREEDALRIEDLGSSNGTFVNGSRLVEATLVNPGDTVQIGPVTFVVQVDGQPADEDLRPYTSGATTAMAPSDDEPTAASTPEDAALAALEGDPRDDSDINFDLDDKK